MCRRPARAIGRACHLRCGLKGGLAHGRRGLLYPPINRPAATPRAPHDKTGPESPLEHRTSSHMLSFFRSMAKSKLLGVLLGLPLLAGILTIGNVRSDLSGLFTPKDAVIQAGSRIYTTDDFKREFEAYRRQMAQQNQQITPDEAVTQGLDQQMLSPFGQRESMYEILHKLGVWPSDKLVVDQIAKVKAFFDPVTGRFDQKTYLQLLQQNQLTPAIFEKGQRDEVAYSQFMTAAAAGLKPPRLYGALVGAYLYENRSLSLFGIKPDVLGKEPVPTDADLTKLMKEHAAALTLPETR